MTAITKGQLVQSAFRHLSIIGAFTQPSATDMDNFLQYLEMMMASWTNKGLNLGYKLSAFGLNPEAAEDSGIAIDDASGVSLNLAVYGAASIGKLLPQSLKSEAYQAKLGLYSSEVSQRESLSVLPAGAGNNHCGGYQSIEDPVTVENNGNLD